MSTNPYLSLVNDALAFGTGLPTKIDLTVQEPSKRPSSAAYNQLMEAGGKRIDAIAQSGRTAPGVDLRENTVAPGLENRLRAMTQVNEYGSISSLADGNVRVRINPNADRAYFAHELGHAAARTTDIGQKIHQMRHNAKLKNALMAAAAITGGSAAALTEGDSEYLGAIALGAGASAPYLLDEALATKNALAIMEGAGMKATAGQRARLAGGLLSYMAPALMVGTAAPAVGNLFD